ncbi:34294_t:CDS:2 [Gigaspora margarita]|uniref:34294_t:CDS:1 n=1 Tax=Gigaspora margarita TaxID=4874 RepID=A0ABN7US22_GIGMA|nr:34294_t:CDS:2 [Gigaspora margarita]
MSSDKNKTNFKENLNKIPSLSLEINNYKREILELFNIIIEWLEKSTNKNEQTKELEDLYNQIEWKQIQSKEKNI